MTLTIIFVGIFVVAFALLMFIIASLNEEKQQEAVPVPVSEVVPSSMQKVASEIAFEAHDQIEQLNKEIDQLKEQIIILEKTSSEAQSISEDNKQLKMELDQSVKKIRALESNLADHLKETQDKYLKVKEQNQIITSQHESVLAEALAPLQSKIEDLELHNQKLMELQQATQAKNDMLQYELIKIRAQAVGQERLAQNFQKELSARGQ